MSDGFTKEQEAFIEKVAYKVVEAAGPKMLEVHVANCRAVKFLSGAKYMLIGGAVVGFTAYPSVINVVKLITAAMAAP